MGAEKLNSDDETVVRHQARWLGVTYIREVGSPADSAVCDEQRTFDRAAYCAGYGPSGGQRDQVDVLAQATGGQVSASECGAAEKGEIVRVGLERGENRGYQMVAADLLKGDTKLLRDSRRFVTP